MTNPLTLTIVVTIVVLFAIPAFPQDELVGDRPDLTESALTVGHLRFQLETGFGWETVENGGVEENLYFNPTLFRFGFSDSFEIRLETASFTKLDIDVPGISTSFEGFSPVAIGVKYNFVKGKDLRETTMGLLIMTELPSGTDEFETENLALAVKLLSEWDLSERFSFATNLGFENSHDHLGGNFYSLTATGSLGIGLSERLGAFLELAAGSKEWSNGDGSLLLDGGVTYLVTERFQIDAAIGTGLAGDLVPDFFMTAGIIYKP